MRLKQGRMDDATVFSDDPVAMAEHWRAQGARRLHIVDLDGAFAGKPRNQSLIRDMVQVMGDIPVQIGGGIRSHEVIEEYLAVGISGVILGTKAVEEPAFLETAAKAHPDAVILGLDARDGMVATDGWDKTSSVSAVELAQAAAELPIYGIVYTDIARDGMMTGVNVQATWQLASESGVRVIASGGVSTQDDLAALKSQFQANPDLLIGAITGRAIYEGSLDLAQGQALFDS